MPGWFAFILALFFITFEGVFLALLGVEQLTLQLGLACVVGFAMTREFWSAGLLVALLLFPIEWSVAGVPGYYAFSLVIVLLLLQPLKGRVRFDGIEAWVIGFGSAMAHAGLMVVFLALTQPESNVIPIVIANMVPTAFLFGFVTSVIALLFRVLDRKFKPVRGNQLELDV